MTSSGQLRFPLKMLHDQEGTAIPGELEQVVDCHVHLFPDQLFEAIWDWFHHFGWEIRYRYFSKKILGFLQAKGIKKIIGLSYAHQPGMAKDLNQYLLDLSKDFPMLIPFGTIYPGEQHALQILKQGFQAGLKGLKLHPHVQLTPIDSPGLEEIFQLCQDLGRPVLIHAGREPRSPKFDYPVDPYQICSAQRVQRVLKNFPGLKICVPHLGADEFKTYLKLMEKYDHLWTDTSMVVSHYLPHEQFPDLNLYPADRVMYGSDFPNIPFAWDRELKIIMQTLKQEKWGQVFAENCLGFVN